MNDAGFSLIELMVAIVVMAIVATVVVASWRAPNGSSSISAIDQLRYDASRRGIVETRELTVGGLYIWMTAYPDGRLITDTSDTKVTVK